MLDLQGKDVLVVGTKRSGMGAIELLVKAGASVRAMDNGEPSGTDRARLRDLGVPVVRQTTQNIPDAGRDPECVVLSPAVPFDLPMFAEARIRGVRVIGEVELSSFFLQGPVIGITGSNGKTTTTALVGHILSECGVACQVGGNIGTAVTTLVSTSKPEQWNVLELSSFQLETVEHFRARISACLNVTPDHLDRHGSFTTYAAAKRRLFETQRGEDFGVLNFEDATCREYVHHTAAQVHWFSSSRTVPQGAWLGKEDLILNGQPYLKRKDVKLRGLHNLENVLAASVIAHLAGAHVDGIAAAIRSFTGVEHRIEFVRDVHGVLYFNDSKATNVDAALKAVEAFEEPLWMILGGKDKGASYQPLVDALRKRGKAVLVIGEEPPYPYAASPLIRKAFDGVVPVVDCGTLQKAVEYSKAHADIGDVVLLAPACASFDQFANYEERGRAFKHFVQGL